MKFKMIKQWTLFLCCLIVQPVYAALPEFTQLVKEQNGIVVNISTKQKHKIEGNGKRFNIPGMPEEFKDFFKKFEDVPDHDYSAQSLGSGFLISADGYILTNFHVIKDAVEIIVRLTDRTEKIATVIGFDKKSDVALLKIPGEKYPFAKIGKPSELEVGEWVLAIGSPFGFDYSVTAGIVSAKGRSLPKENYVPFIQTDVAINPGNSGGPLFNLKGEVVGVNSQIYSRTGGFMGLSFSIPIDMAMDAVHQLKDKGRVSRGWLGVVIQDVTRELAESFSMSRAHGALVSRVLAGGPAEKAGFEVGDIIVEFNQKPVERSAMLPPIVGVTKVFSVVKVEIIRRGKPVTLSVRIDELPSDDNIKLSRTDSTKVLQHGRLGLVVSDLTKKQKSDLSVSSGVIINDVQEGAAKLAGITKGDVILMVDGKNLKDVAHFKVLVKSLKAGRSVAVLVHRKRGPSFVALKVPE
ncbi:MAG: Do family serine endopeptidase [Methylococcales bacterium]|jgi:serine protease Do|nr:Do family serine endopeptidase [Methylococcales bacterium]MBT7444925.1 Do family serine endopeptidase [Methylococcales bacterium]